MGELVFAFTPAAQSSFGAKIQKLCKNIDCYLQGEVGKEEYNSAWGKQVELQEGSVRVVLFLFCKCIFLKKYLCLRTLHTIPKTLQL